MNETTFCTTESPIGRLAIHTRGDAIVVLDWVTTDPARPKTALEAEATYQLAAYFAGKLKSFDLPLAPDGTLHQKKVWAEMSRVPFGSLRTYGDLAKIIGSGAQAIGTACSKNPIPIIVPCHRIVATGGGIGGYSGHGGVSTKQTLLALEGSVPGQ